MAIAGIAIGSCWVAVGVFAIIDPHLLAS
jgi:hypothetical protein